MTHTAMAPAAWTSQAPLCQRARSHVVLEVPDVGATTIGSLDQFRSQEGDYRWRRIQALSQANPGRPDTRADDGPAIQQGCIGPTSKNIQARRQRTSGSGYPRRGAMLARQHLMRK